MKHLPKKSALLATLVLPFLFSSCIAVAAIGAGAAGAYYYKSSAEAHVQATPQAVIQAAYETATEMELTIAERAATALDGRLVAHTADDDRVKVSVEAAPDGGSDATVRVGFADQDAARRILDSILEKLATGDGSGS